MARHHCGAENADNAKFCIACGEKLTAAENPCLSCGAPNKPGAKFCGKCGTGMSATIAATDVPAPEPVPQPATESMFSPAPVVQTVMASTARVTPAPEKTLETISDAPRSGKSGVMVLGGAVLVAVLAGAGWWFSGKNENVLPEAGVEVSASQAVAQPVQAPPPATVTAAAAEPAPPKPEAVQAPVAATADASPQVIDKPLEADKSAQPAAEDKARRLREEKARRKAEQDAQRLEAEKVRQREAEDRARAEQRARADEAARRAQQPQQAQQAASGSVQQTCGKYTSAISRSLCETRECARPSLYDTAYCVEFRKRYGNGEEQRF
ncbi:zinc ribbon domain-containing protein [Janthinobacterium sp. 17J80-10]|uniref:zinc ribbon domain-containing protein n=1 Tax=Janthinobacterium sp. 17J80-10 TaxID=2497863 RepID=UPI0013E8E562|nr:zinc ribbon domain-containing protein [Janthinobacterium sp. 17J80-10]